jgi:hypothetical protein
MERRLSILPLDRSGFMSVQPHWNTVYRTKAPDEVNWFQTRPRTSLKLVDASGLDVARYDAHSICSELGADFQLMGQTEQAHTTPWYSTQAFSYFRFHRRMRVA